MIRLVAHFDVEIPGRCLVSWPDEDPILFHCQHNEFEIKVTLVPSHDAAAKEKDAINWTRLLSAVHLEVSRLEEHAPPPVVPNARGMLDYSIQLPYFQPRIEQYGLVACEIVNRILRFFKYELNTPNILEFHADEECFQNAKWTDENGTLAGIGPSVGVATAIPGLWGELGVKKLTFGDSQKLQEALANSIEPSLFEQILADARTALFEQHLRRAVLELAIACEILVKRTFFSENAISGVAFEYLEDKSKINVKVLELIDGVAKEAFGRSFREDHPTDYRSIDHLFRCRNKVAHRGVLSYREDSIVYTVDENLIKTWWSAVDRLHSWMSAQVPI